MLEMSETEYMVRGHGYLRGIDDIEKLVLKSRERHAGADTRRGAGGTGAR